MYVKDGVEFDIDVAHAIGDVQYPPGWFRDPEQRAAFDIEEALRTDRPVFGPTQKVVQDGFVRNADGVLVANWLVVDKTAEELVSDTVDLAALKVAKNAEIDQWRLEANRTHFPVGDKFVAVDVLSRSDIDGTAGYISLFGAFPPAWPGGWKATDSSIIPMPTVDDFKAMYAAMIARGTENFNRSEALKETLATAATPEAVATIEW